MLQRAILSAIVLLSAAACDQRAAFERMIPKDDVAFAIRTFEQLQNRDFEAVESLLAPSVATAAARPQLEQVAAAFGNEKPSNVRVIGAQTNIINETAYVNLTLEYQLPQSWLVAAIALHHADAKRIVDGLHVQPTLDSQERLNRFDLGGRGIVSYGILVWACAAPLFIVGTLVVLWRTSVPRRKWLWALFVAIGIGQVSVNWATGQTAIQPLQVSLLGAGFFKAGPYAPVILTCSIPVGAIVFLSRRRRWLANTPLQPTSGSSMAN